MKNAILVTGIAVLTLSASGATVTGDGLTLTPPSGNETTIDLRAHSAPSTSGLTLSFLDSPSTGIFKIGRPLSSWQWRMLDENSIETVAMALYYDHSLVLIDDQGRNSITLASGYEYNPGYLCLSDTSADFGTVYLSPGDAGQQISSSFSLFDPSTQGISIFQESGFADANVPATLKLWDRSVNSSTPTIVIDGGNSSSAHASTITIGGSPVITQTTGDARYLKPGTNRIAFGTGASASADYSFAFGDGSWANGIGAVAMGVSPRNPDGSLMWRVYAEGKGAVAMGNGSQSFGDGATAIGLNSYAYGKGSVVFGQLSRVDNNAEDGVAIGRGNIVTAVQGVGIGLGNFVEGPQSVALGWGNHTFATSTQGFTAGALNENKGPGGISLGAYNIVDANGFGAVALGWGNRADQQGSIAAGLNNTTLAGGAVALGWSNIANDYASTAIGDSNKAEARYSLAAGRWSHVVPWAWNGVAIGMGTESSGGGQVVVGSYNQPLPYAGDILKPAGDDAVFIIGSGYQTNSGVQMNMFDYTATPAGSVGVVVKKNALVVRYNGDTVVTGNVTSQKTTGFNKFKAPVLVPESGDISMGEFRSGEEP